MTVRLDIYPGSVVFLCCGYAEVVLLFGRVAVVLWLRGCVVVMLRLCCGHVVVVSRLCCGRAVL